MIAATLALAAALTQHSPAVDGMVPYMFTFKNGDPVLYAYVDPAHLDRVSIPVRIDEPWNKSTFDMNLQKSFIADSSEELSSTREARLKRAWEAAGGQEITDRSGNKYWVLKSDLDKRQRAESMIATAFPERVEEAVEPSSAGEMKEGAAPGPGFLALWGGHVAVIFGGVLAAAGVVWWAVRRPWAPV